MSRKTMSDISNIKNMNIIEIDSEKIIKTIRIINKYGWGIRDGESLDKLTRLGQ